MTTIRGISDACWNALGTEFYETNILNPVP